MSRLGLGGTQLAGAHAAAGDRAGHGPLHDAGVRSRESTESWCALGRGWRLGALRGLNQLGVHDLKFLSVPLQLNKQSVFALVVWERSLVGNVLNLHEKRKHYFVLCMIKGEKVAHTNLQPQTLSDRVILFLHWLCFVTTGLHWILRCTALLSARLLPSPNDASLKRDEGARDALKEKLAP